MNFDWRKSTPEDFELFNNWHKVAKLKNSNSDRISTFLTGDALLGTFIKKSILRGSDNLKSITATLNSKAVGVIVAYVRQKNSEVDAAITIEAIAVNPEFIGRGIGTAMIFDVVKNSDKILGITPDYFVAAVDSDNKSSCGAFENNGFSAGKAGCFKMRRYLLEKERYPELRDRPNEKFVQFVHEVMSMAKLEKNNITIKK